MRSQIVFQIVALTVFVLTASEEGHADGKVIPRKQYKGSLEERSQEAIIIFNGGTQTKSATEDMILKIEVEGDAREFAWVVPFPTAPKVSKEAPKLFKEIFDYVQARKRRRSKGDGATKSAPQAATNGADVDSKVEVVSRQVVGDFEIVVVQEKEEGGLNPWLKKEGFQELENAEDVIGYYRKKGYFFACMKVTSEALASEKTIESHPLRFRFDTTGRDGIYFPMKMTSLQEKPFDINLYVFYSAWLNDKLSQFGYKHRGFRLNYRDWDTNECEPNAGKTWSSPEDDPFLKNMAHRIPLLTKLFQKLHPGQRYYLTNIQSRNVKPEDIREWTSDLWMFPYYINRKFVPYDVRGQGPAAEAYPFVAQAAVKGSEGSPSSDDPVKSVRVDLASGENRWPMWTLAIPSAAVGCIILWTLFRKTPS